MPVPLRTLGRSGLRVSAIGLGCMGMSQAYGPADENESVATLHRALELGVTFFDTANAYGLGHNEQLLGRVLADHRDQVVLATKVRYGRLTGRPDGRRRATRVRQRLVATSRSAASGSTRSTSTTSTASTGRCRSRRRLGRWASWSPPARSATWAHVSGFSLFAASAEEQAEAYAAVLPLITSGKITPTHDRSFPLEQAPEALRHLVEDRPFGKVTLTVDAYPRAAGS